MSILNNLTKKIGLVSFFFCSLISSPSFASMADRAEVKSFIQHMHQAHGFNKRKLQILFQKINSNPKILLAVNRPFEEKPWDHYQARFVTDERAQKGVNFWQQHEATLTKAEKEFGVPAEIIVAVLGAETNYGQYTGQFSVFESLSTLAFDFPRRSVFFKKELEEYLQLCRENKWDPLTIKGSYAGAMGKPQFIASTYRYYAVDYNKKGHRDIINDTDDAIGSIAHYFKKHGWINGVHIAEKARMTKKDYAKLPPHQARHPKPDLTHIQLDQLGIAASKKMQAIDRLALVALQKQDGFLEHWLGSHNFYVITRYNQSTNYAMAVFQLSDRIRELRLVAKVNKAAS